MQTYVNPILVYLLLLSTSLLNQGAYANESSLKVTLKVVTSFSVLEDLVKELGGEHVSVVNLVNRNSDAHMYQPKPSDAVAIAAADLVVFNGLGFEGWMSRLINNSGYNKSLLIASEGVNAIKNGDEVDPHAWQSFDNIRVYINNITQTLVQLKPDYASEFSQLQQQYLTHLDAIETRLSQQLAKIPNDARIVVTSHDAFGYLGRDFNIQFLAPVGLSVENEASAEDVAAVIQQIREREVKAIFVENITNARLLKVIADETNVAIGGSLYSDALSEQGGPAASYIAMMSHNLESLIAAFTEH